MSKWRNGRPGVLKLGAETLDDGVLFSPGRGVTLEQKVVKKCRWAASITIDAAASYNV
jgi:hypothetical protein